MGRAPAEDPEGQSCQAIQSLATRWIAGRLETRVKDKRLLRGRQDLAPGSGCDYSRGGWVERKAGGSLQKERTATQEAYSSVSFFYPGARLSDRANALAILQIQEGWTE